MNINSDKIRIYPVSNRKNTQGEISIYGELGRLNIEENVISNYRKITDLESFVIKDVSVNIESDLLSVGKGILCLSGYIFEITNKGISFNLSNFDKTKTLYVYAKANLIQKTINGLTIYELNNVDDQGKFKGFEIIYSDSLFASNDTSKYFLIGKFNYLTSRASWSENQVKTLKSRFNINNMGVEISDTSLSKNQSVSTIEKWLTDDFILDDGEI